MTIKCPKCGTKINAAKLFASKGGSATGPSKARTPEQARAAAMARWSKVNNDNKPRKINAKRRKG